MNTWRVVARMVGALAVLAAMSLPTLVAAAPVRPHSGGRCFVQDANGVQYLDNECEYHEVLQYDASGRAIAVLNYQDRGQLPPGAALPETTIRFVLHVDCGCVYDGDYQAVLAPNGEYHSYGPINLP